MIADEENFAKQARIHSSHLTSFGRYSENQNVEEYILLFTPKTLPGLDLPLAIVKLSLVETYEIIEGPSHILIVNCERDTRIYSTFHDVIHDLRQYDPDEMYTYELRQALLEAIDNNK